MVIVKTQPFSPLHPSKRLVGLSKILCVCASDDKQAPLESTRVESRQAEAAPAGWPHGRGKRGPDTYKRDTNPPLENQLLRKADSQESRVINVTFAGWFTCMAVGEVSGWFDCQSSSIDSSAVSHAALCHSFRSHVQS